MNEHSKVLLLAGGLGTRLRPLTLSTPKCLIPVSGRPLLDYWFDRFREANIQDVLINNHHHPDQVREYINQKNAMDNWHVSEAFEPELLGSAGTVHANRVFADDADHILIVYADNLSLIDLSAFMDFHVSHVAPITMALFHTPYPKMCGIAELDGDGRVTAFVEKPEEPKSDLANAGVYAVTADVFHEIADMNVFDFGFDVLPEFIGRMFGWTWEGYHRDIGSIESLEQAEQDVPEFFASEGND